MLIQFLLIIIILLFIILILLAMIGRSLDKILDVLELIKEKIK